jgi:hypothetical protein
MSQMAFEDDWAEEIFFGHPVLQHLLDKVPDKVPDKVGIGKGSGGVEDFGFVVFFRVDTTKLGGDESFGCDAAAVVFLGIDPGAVVPGGASVRGAAYGGAFAGFRAGAEGGAGRLASLVGAGSGYRVAFRTVSVGVTQVAAQCFRSSGGLRCGGTPVRSHFSADRIAAVATPG